MSGKTVLVLGATGQQGGSVAAALNGGGWRVRALVRDPVGPKGRALSAAASTVPVSSVPVSSMVPATARGGSEGVLGLPHGLGPLHLGGGRLFPGVEPVE